MLKSDIKPNDLPQVDGFCCGHHYLKLSDPNGCICLCNQCQAFHCGEAEASPASDIEAITAEPSTNKSAAGLPGTNKKVAASDSISEAIHQPPEVSLPAKEPCERFQGDKVEGDNKKHEAVLTNPASEAGTNTTAASTQVSTSNAVKKDNNTVQGHDNKVSLFFMLM